MNLIRGHQMIGVRVGTDIIQRPAATITDAWRIIRENWDKTPLYASCSMRYSTNGRGQEYYMDRIWYDSDGKLENCLADLRRIERAAEEWGTDAVGQLSKSGIHPHIFLEPEWMSRNRIEDLILAKRKIITYCNLRTIDWSGFADMAKLPRIPNSLTSDNTYCIQVYPGEWLEDLLKARTARRDYRSRIKQISLSKLLEILKDVKPAEVPITFRQALRTDLANVKIKPQTEMFEKPCMQACLSLDSPPAFMRHDAVVRMKKLDWDEEKIRLYFQGLDTIDYNEGIVKDMVKSSYRYEWAASCVTIELNGCCLGPSCKFYKNRTGTNRRGRNAT